MITEILLEPARVWLRRGALDREIARGADLTRTPGLARRARQLASPRCRRRIAQGLRNLVDGAQEPDHVLSAAVPIQRKQILGEQGFLLQLAVDLESDEAVSPRGVALLERLLTDGDSPFYTPTPNGSVHDALIHAHAALHLA